MYDPSLLVIDDMDPDVRIQDGATFYRLASISHCEEEDILSGDGPSKGDGRGRFHLCQQRASYFSDNILVCIAEVLYHMYRDVLVAISSGSVASIVRSKTTSEKALMVFQVREIDSLANIDASDFAFNHGNRIKGTTTVYPDSTYEPFYEIMEPTRSKYRGLVYPSARHSRDRCFVLFRDESRCVKGLVGKAYITLKLITEKQDYGNAPTVCDPTTEKIHPTVGYYEIRDTTFYETIKANGDMNPRNMTRYGYVDYVRRKYIRYPEDAILWE